MPRIPLSLFLLALPLLLCALVAPSAARAADKGGTIEWKPTGHPARLDYLKLQDFPNDPAQRALLRMGIPGHPWTDPATGMEFVWVPQGCFQMGSNSGEADEKPVHEVCVDGFWLGKYEVTQGQWSRVMGGNPSKFQKGDDYPVEQVSWNDAQEFIKKLSGRGNGKFRLPTEAEWEYAARSGGRSETYAGGEDVDRVAWYGSNSGGSTHRVGTKAPNGLGLYDMSGNVWEWCEDWYAKDAYSSHSRNNPISNNRASGSRVLRGGCWVSSPAAVRSAGRGGNAPGYRNCSYGFRLVRLPQD